VTDAARHERLSRAARRDVRIFAALAVVVPIALHLLYARRVRELEALADHGARADAVVTAKDGEAVELSYLVDGVEQTWSARVDGEPLARGEHFDVTYLPESPARCWPGPPPTPARIASETGVLEEVAIGAFAFFAACFALALRGKRRLARTAPGALPPPKKVSPRVVGRITAALLFATLVGVELDPKVVEVQVKAFGAAPLGLPVQAVVIAADLVLFAPFVVVLEHLANVVEHAREDGVWLTKGAILDYLVFGAGKHPHLGRSRVIVLGGLVYFAAIVGAWIAYASAKGI
jgi:hypothetical protein